jgi:hypothetical protein
MVADIIHIYNLSIISQFVNVFSSSIFFYWGYRYRLTMDESKLETKVKSCAKCIVIRYIFRVMYEKIVIA